MYLYESFIFCDDKFWESEHFLLAFFLPLPRTLFMLIIWLDLKYLASWHVIYSAFPGRFSSLLAIKTQFNSIKWWWNVSVISLHFHGRSITHRESNFGFSHNLGCSNYASIYRIIYIRPSLSLLKLVVMLARFEFYSFQFQVILFYLFIWNSMFLIYFLICGVTAIATFRYVCSILQW